MQYLSDVRSFYLLQDYFLSCWHSVCIVNPMLIHHFHPYQMVPLFQLHCHSHYLAVLKLLVQRRSKKLKGSLLMCVKNFLKHGSGQRKWSSKTVTSGSVFVHSQSKIISQHTACNTTQGYHGSKSSSK